MLYKLLPKGLASNQHTCKGWVQTFLHPKRAGKQFPIFLFQTILTINQFTSISLEGACTRISHPCIYGCYQGTGPQMDWLQQPRGLHPGIPQDYSRHKDSCQWVGTSVLSAAIPNQSSAEGASKTSPLQSFSARDLTAGFPSLCPA